MTLATIVPNYGATLSTKIRTISHSVHYVEQRAEDGINAIVRDWSVSFTDSPTNIEALELELSNLRGFTPFSWTPPDGVVGNWICKEFSVSQDNYSQSTLSTNFVEVF